MPKRITNNGHQSSNQNPVSLELISRLSFSLFILNENRKTQYSEIEYRHSPCIGIMRKAFQSLRQLLGFCEVFPLLRYLRSSSLFLLAFLFESPRAISGQSPKMRTNYKTSTCSAMVSPRNIFSPLPFSFFLLYTFLLTHRRRSH